MTKPTTSSKTGIIVLTTLLILFYSCKKDVTSDNAIAVFSAAKGSLGGKPTKLAERGVIVSFSSAQDDGTACMLTGDGSDFTNGSQNVSAKLDAYGNLLFNTQANSRQAVQRHLNYDFSQPADASSTSLSISTNSSKSCVFNMIASNYSCTPFVPLQNLSKGASESVGIGGGFSGQDGKDYHVSFHRSAEDTQDTPTSFAVVTRTKDKTQGDAVDEWTIVSTGSSCPSSSNVGSLKQYTSTSSTDVGYYVLPFKMTLVGQ